MKGPVVLAVSLALFAGVAVAQPENPSAADPLAKASVEGKYRMLLRAIRVPEDTAAWGEFREFGYWSGAEWAGYTELPSGYWVYVSPSWYIVSTR